LVFYDYSVLYNAHLSLTSKLRWILWKINYLARDEHSYSVGFFFGSSISKLIKLLTDLIKIITELIKHITGWILNMLPSKVVPILGYI
jgi:hypothetical protein